MKPWMWALVGIVGYLMWSRMSTAEDIPQGSAAEFGMGPAGGGSGSVAPASTGGGRKYDDGTGPRMTRPTPTIADGHTDAVVAPKSRWPSGGGSKVTPNGSSGVRVRDLEAHPMPGLDPVRDWLGGLLS